MKVLANDIREKEGGIHMMHKHEKPTHPEPHHRLEPMLHIEYDEQDWEILRASLRDEDTAGAAAYIIRNAPPEIQIIISQITDIIKTIKEAS